MRPVALAFLICIAGAAAAPAGPIASSLDPAAIPEAKRTPLGFYLTPAEAHAALTADPSILFVDVRDPIEIAFVGHAEGVDSIAPYELFTHRFDPEAGAYAGAPNPGFVAAVEAAAARAGTTPADPVFLICRSGGRSARAAEALIAAGWSNVWNLVEGFEGDMNRETGERDRNGWRNAGLPWTYRLTAETAWSAP